MDWISKFKCRCSAINKMKSNSRSNPQITEKQAETLREYRMKLDAGLKITTKQAEELIVLEEKENNSNKIVLSDTCIEYLMEVYSWEQFGMIPVGKESVMELNISTKKGKLVEVQSLLLNSVVTGEQYKVHKERIFNDYLSGEVDSYTGDHIYAATMVDDMKNSTDMPTFLKKINKGLENGQKEQLQGYGDITGAKILNVTNALVDMPDILVEEIRWSVLKATGATTDESPEFIAEWPRWERSIKFTHIPVHQRILKLSVEPFTEFERQKVYDKVKICRDWLFYFHEKYQNLNLS